jgi:hypothetical protein
MVKNLKNADETYQKRLLQITLAKNLSSRAKHELLATALDGRNILEAYEICPECNAPAGLFISRGYPCDETMKAAANGELELGGCDLGIDDPDYTCINCDHYWCSDIEDPYELDDSDSDIKESE